MTDSLFYVVPCAALINDKGEIFVARRKKGKKMEGYWEFPGGKLKLHEEPEEALKREFKEELNILIDDIRLFHIKPYTYEHGNVFILFYTARQKSGTITLKDHDDCQWLPPQDLKKLKLVPANDEAIEKLTIRLSP